MQIFICFETPHSSIGIGYETAKVFARLGATVVLACRSQERGEAARSRLLRELAAELPNSEAASLSNRIEFMRLDLASFASIRFFADSFKKTHNQLDLLVNNAGVMSMQHVLHTSLYFLHIFNQCTITFRLCLCVC